MEKPSGTGYCSQMAERRDSEMDVQTMKMKALDFAVAVFERKDEVSKESHGERLTLEKISKELSDFLKRYETGEWKPANGNSKPKDEVLNNENT